MVLRIDNDLKVEATGLADGAVYRVSATVTDIAGETPPTWRISFFWNKASGKPGLAAAAQKALAQARAEVQDDPVIAAVLAAVPTEDLSPAVPTTTEPDPAFGESADKPLYVKVVTV